MLALWALIVFILLAIISRFLPPGVPVHPHVGS